MEWAVETVLPREVNNLNKQLYDRKKAIKDSTLALSNDDITEQRYQDTKVRV